MVFIPSDAAAVSSGGGFAFIRPDSQDARCCRRGRRCYLTEKTEIHPPCRRAHKHQHVMYHPGTSLLTFPVSLPLSASLSLAASLSLCLSLCQLPLSTASWLLKMPFPELQLPPRLSLRLCCLLQLGGSLSCALSCCGSVQDLFCSYQATNSSSSSSSKDSRSCLLQQLQQLQKQIAGREPVVLL